MAPLGTESFCLKLGSETQETIEGWEKRGFPEGGVRPPPAPPPPPSTATLIPGGIVQLRIRSCGELSDWMGYFEMKQLYSDKLVCEELFEHTPLLDLMLPYIKREVPSSRMSLERSFPPPRKPPLLF